MPTTDAENKRIRPGRGRRWLRPLAIPCVLAAVALAAGFLVFANGVPRSEEKAVRAADGIVVLTGGASRIVDAVELLSADRGKRLLISGVNPTTTHAELIRMNPEVERLLVGRIDLGREATNTIGNAIETGHWVREQKFRSLIVVTSGWHMPRALIEIAHELPGVTLIPYPVVSDRMRDEPWWSDAQTIRLLLVEYVKYVASYVRVRLDPTRLAAGERRPQS
ncbi:MAG: YdcF family protein [Xanthobacteraceae bacterium]